MIIAATTTVGSLAAHEYQNNPAKVVYSGVVNLSSAEPGENWDEMVTIAALNKKTRKPMAVLVVSPPAERTKTMGRLQWELLAIEAARRMGFADNQYSWAVHGNTDEMHMHIIANRINFIGINTVESARIGVRAGVVADKIALSLGWETVKQLGAKRREGMLSSILEHAGTSTNWTEVGKKMSDQGYHIEVSYSNIDGMSTFNGLRIMMEEEYRKRREREDATEKAEELGKSIMMLKEYNFAQLLKAREIGRDMLPEAEQSKVLSEAETKVLPGFTFSKLTRSVKARDLDKMLAANLQSAKKSGGDMEGPTVPNAAETMQEGEIYLKVLNIMSLENVYSRRDFIEELYHDDLKISEDGQYIFDYEGKFGVPLKYFENVDPKKYPTVDVIKEMLLDLGDYKERQHQIRR